MMYGNVIGKGYCYSLGKFNVKLYGMGDAAPNTPADITVGMTLTNDSGKPIPVYGTVDASGDPVMTIQPGDEIGNVLGVAAGVGGTIYAITNSTLQANAPILDEAVAEIWNDTFGQALPDTQIYESGSVKFSDLQNLSTGQISAQKTAVTLQNQNNSFQIPTWVYWTAGTIGLVIVAGTLNNIFGRR